MFRKIAFTLALLLAVPGGIAFANLLTPVQGSGNSVDVTVGTTTHSLSFPADSLRSAQDRLRDILYYLRTFDAVDPIPVAAPASSTAPTTSNIYTDIADVAFSVEEDTTSAIDTINALAQDTVCHLFSGSLEIGDQGPEVLELQRFLNEILDAPLAQSGPGSPGNETDYFGSITFAGVFAFQALHADAILTPLGLLNPTGYWGASSIAQANSLTGCGN